MVLGEGLGVRKSSLSPPNEYSGTLNWHPGKASVCGQIPWSAVAIHQGERLAQLGQGVVDPLIPDALLEKPVEEVSAGEFAIATLPIALFYHDNLTQQRHYLESTVALWGGDSSTSDVVIAFAYAIAEAIKEQLVPTHFIPQLLSYLHVSLPESATRSVSLMAGLETLKKLVATGAELQSIMAALPSRDDGVLEIAIALYCFLQTPDSISLALSRSVRLGVKPGIVGALVGALTGAYVSEVGIPAEWQSALRSPFATPELSLQRIQHLSIQLVSTWSGVYNPCDLQNRDLPVVTVPWVTRSR
jgi:hypothetical protein